MFAKLNLYSLIISENMLLFAGEDLFTWSSIKWAYLWKKFWKKGTLQKNVTGVYIKKFGKEIPD